MRRITTECEENLSRRFLSTTPIRKLFVQWGSVTAVFFECNTSVMCVQNHSQEFDWALS